MVKSRALVFLPQGQSVNEEQNFASALSNWQKTPSLWLNYNGKIHLYKIRPNSQTKSAWAVLPYPSHAPSYELKV